MIVRRSFPLLAFLLVAFPTSGWGQEKPPEKAADKPAEVKKEEPKRDPKSLEYEKAVKDLKKVDGALTFYQRKKEILLELPESKVGQLLYVQATLGSGASGGVQAGDPVNNIDAFRLDRTEEQINFVRPNTRFRWEASNPLAVSSQRSLPEATLASFRIEQTDPEKKLILVNVTNLFFGDVFRLNEMISAGMGAPYMLDSNRSAPETVSSFPENAVVRMALSYNAARGGAPSALAELLGLLGGGNFLEDSRNMPLKVVYNLWFPKKSDYTPRSSDPRIGYFTSDYYSVDRFMDRDRTVRFINRWNLKKKDPTAALSEPVKPIVWTLDPSIPEKYRGAVKRGVLYWTKAFEAAGYKNAIQVQDAPKDDKSYDHADGRYNVIRWTMTPDQAYAVALFRTDPFTGEMLNAAVTFDANMPQFAQFENSDFVIPGATATARAGKAFLRGGVPAGKSDQALFSPKESTPDADALLHKFGWNRTECSHASEFAQDAAYNWFGLEALPAASNREEYLQRFVSDVVSHEVGHCLGLRHNFVASTYLTTSQMADDALTSKVGYSASVMDYNPVNTAAILKGRGNFYMPTIGPYDMWAIKYGYAPIKASDWIDEKYELNRIASQAGKPGLAFNTDENADGFNPYVVRFDGGQDPIAFSEQNLKVARRVLQYAITQLPKPGESFELRTNLIQRSLMRTFREGRLSARFLGGIVTRRLNAGDSAKPILEPVDAATQRKALRLITEYCFSEKAFSLPVPVKLNLGLDPAQEGTADWTAPLREQISSMQQLMAALMLSADRLDQIAENAYKLEGKPGQVYTLAEHYRGIVGSAFSEVGANRSIPALRRDLQRAVLEGLLTQAGARTGQINGDARSIAGLQVRDLLTRVRAQAAKPAKLDESTRLHLRGMSEEMTRFLGRQVQSTR